MTRFRLISSSNGLPAIAAPFTVTWRWAFRGPFCPSRPSNSSEIVYATAYVPSPLSTTASWSNGTTPAAAAAPPAPPPAAAQA